MQVRHVPGGAALAADIVVSINFWKQTNGWIEACLKLQAISWLTSCLCFVGEWALPAGAFLANGSWYLVFRCLAFMLQCIMFSVSLTCPCLNGTWIGANTALRAEFTPLSKSEQHCSYFGGWTFVVGRATKEGLWPHYGWNRYICVCWLSQWSLFFWHYRVCLGVFTLQVKMAKRLRHVLCKWAC